jgi:hypothetical protein
LRLAVAQGRAELTLAAGPACCQVVPAGEAVRAIEGQPRISSAAPLLAAEWQRLLGTIPGFTDPKLPAADVPAGVWVPRWPGRNGPTPGSRTRVRMVYSAELGGGVLFGGQGGDNALWCYEARADRWKRVADAHELRKAADAGLFPEPRHGHVLAALPGWGLLLTGGNARLDPGLVWRLRPGSTSWMRAADDRKCWPLYAANCASPGAGKVYVFGAEGNLPESGFAAFDVRAGQWRALRPSPMPVKRTGMDNCMCWDSKRERILLLRCPARNDPADTPVQTWSYVPASNLWVDLKPAVLPGNRDHGAMDYSPRADAVLLYGGGGANSETWSFHCGSNRWERLDPVNNPPPRSGHALYYDPAADLFATYGGEGPGGARDDIWTFRLAPNR